MSDIEINLAKARSEVAQAEERLKGTVWERVTKDKIRFSEAAEQYARAGNFFRLAKQGSLFFTSPVCPWIKNFKDVLSLLIMIFLIYFGI